MLMQVAQCAAGAWYAHVRNAVDESSSSRLGHLHCSLLLVSRLGYHQYKPLGMSRVCGKNEAKADLATRQSLGTVQLTQDEVETYAKVPVVR